MLIKTSYLTYIGRVAVRLRTLYVREVKDAFTNFELAVHRVD